jgi:hypothetical protein
VDVVVGLAREQRRADRPTRTGTLPGMPAVSGEHAATLPAPRVDAPTRRVPTPTDVRIDLGTPLPPPSDRPEGAVIEALRRRAEAAEARLQHAPPASVPPATDQALGRSVRFLVARFWPLLLAAVGLGGGAVATARPTADPAKVAATTAELAAVQSRLTILEAERSAAQSREVQRDAMIRCLRRLYDEAHQQTLPAPDRMGTAQKPRPWKDDCGQLP